jgi:hypothetical protein
MVERPLNKANPSSNADKIRNMRVSDDLKDLIVSLVNASEMRIMDKIDYKFEQMEKRLDRLEIENMTGDKKEYQNQDLIVKPPTCQTQQFIKKASFNSSQRPSGFSSRALSPIDEMLNKKPKHHNSISP